SNEVLEFKNKTNREIIESIHNEFDASFNPVTAQTGDFILCKLVVLDNKKHDRRGTVRQIVNQMQSEHTCKIENGDNAKAKGGKLRSPANMRLKQKAQPTPQEIEKRWDKKRLGVAQLADNMRSLKINLTKDLDSKEEKEFLTALAIK